MSAIFFNQYALHIRKLQLNTVYSISHIPLNNCPPLKEEDLEIGLVRLPIHPSDAIPQKLLVGISSYISVSGRSRNEAHLFKTIILSYHNILDRHFN